MGCKCIDTEDELRYSRAKCSGEVPSCKRCLRKEIRCGGYHTPATIRKRRQLLTARDNIRNLSASGNLHSMEQHGTSYQIPAPRNDDWNAHVNPGLQQNDITNHSTWPTNVRIYHPVDFATGYPVKALARPI